MVSVTILDVGQNQFFCQSRQKLQQMYGICSTFNADNSAIIDIFHADFPTANIVLFKQKDKKSIKTLEQ